MYLNPLIAGFVLMTLAICALAAVVYEQGVQISKLQRARDKRGRFVAKKEDSSGKS